MPRRIGACLAGALLVGGLAAGAWAGDAPASPGAEGEFKRGALGGRAYRLFVPSASPAGRPLPLVIALHGCWQTPEDFALGTRLNQAAQRRGLLVLYPAQGPLANPSRCWNWFEPSQQGVKTGEVAGILALAREVQSASPVDPRRVIALGFSAGGFMAVNLACAAPDLVSRVGVVAGGPYRCGLGVEGAIGCMRGIGLDGAASAAACLRATGRGALALRASLWHGADDTVVSPANQTALVAMFARLTGMVSGVTERVGGGVHSLYRDGRGHAVFEAWTIPGLGHEWSGGDTRGTQTVSWGPGTTDHMLDFLLE